MANDQHVALLKQGVDTWNAWRDENPQVGVDLSGANLSGARKKAAVSKATLQQFLDAQKKDQCYRTDDFLANGEHSAQKLQFSTFVKAGKTILFEPDGIVVKEDVAAVTIHGPNVNFF